LIRRLGRRDPAAPFACAAVDEMVPTLAPCLAAVLAHLSLDAAPAHEDRGLHWGQITPWRPGGTRCRSYVDRRPGAIFCRWPCDGCVAVFPVGRSRLDTRRPYPRGRLSAQFGASADRSNPVCCRSGLFRPPQQGGAPRAGAPVRALARWERGVDLSLGACSYGSWLGQRNQQRCNDEPARQDTQRHLQANRLGPDA
jgi:hypothetical protein